MIEERESWEYREASVIRFCRIECFKERLAKSTLEIS